MRGGCGRGTLKKAYTTSSAATATRASKANRRYIPSVGVRVRVRVRFRVRVGVRVRVSKY